MYISPFREAHDLVNVLFRDKGWPEPNAEVQREQDNIILHYIIS